jgi:hypothetical protein
MMALMFIETDFSEEQMKTSLDAAYKGVVSAKLDFGYSAEQVLQNSSIQIIVYGGSTAGLKDLETGYEGFKNIISASKDFGPDSPGVPLAYKFRHLSDNTLALVTLTSQYTLEKQLALRQRVRVTVLHYLCHKSDDEGSGNHVDIDRFQVIIQAYNRKDANDLGKLITKTDSPVPGWESVYNWADPGAVEMGVGHVQPVNKSVDLTFDTENYDFNLAKLKLAAYARDNDKYWANDDEEAWGEIELAGDQFFENGGTHSFRIYSADFEFEVQIRITKLD